MMVMSMTSKLNSKGQTTLPKEIRDKLGVHSGDTLIYEVEGNAVRVRKAEPFDRSEEHTSELQSLRHLVCRLLLEKKKTHLNYSHLGISYALLYLKPTNRPHH